MSVISIFFLFKFNIQSTENSNAKLQLIPLEEALIGRIFSLRIKIFYCCRAECHLELKAEETDTGRPVPTGLGCWRVDIQVFDI